MCKSRGLYQLPPALFMPEVPRAPDTRSPLGEQVARAGCQSRLLNSSSQGGSGGEVAGDLVDLCKVSVEQLPPCGLDVSPHLLGTRRTGYN